MEMNKIISTLFNWERQYEINTQRGDKKKSERKIKR